MTSLLNVDVSTDKPFNGQFLLISFISTSLAFVAGSSWATFFQNFLNSITPNEPDTQKKQPFYSFIAALFVSIVCIVIFYLLYVWGRRKKVEIN